MLSMTSTASHPLRQTSFPPESSSQAQSFSRSPSVESASLVSGVSGAKKKRGRKQKGKADDETSAVGSRAKSAVSGTSGRGRRRASRDASAEDDDEEGGGETAVTIVARTDEEKKKEKEHKAMLLTALNPDQFQRYEAWRASKLPDSVVRRVCRTLLSYSWQLRANAE
jgi:transcription initiation factor TFIID subunit 11